jgi:hypothetical protein
MRIDPETASRTPAEVPDNCQIEAKKRYENLSEHIDKAFPDA